MLNWTVEQCLAMTDKCDQVSSEIQHEADTIMKIIVDHPQMAGAYSKRMEELKEEAKTILAITVALGNCIRKQME